MNFFEQQDQARRQTRTLVIPFALAVLAIVAAVNLVAALLWTLGQPGLDAALYPKGFFLANTVITIGLIVAGTLVEIYRLRDGGEAVARMAGGRPVSPATRDPRERRLLNVVEEMALASGLACPKVYVLDREESINAFAAGYNPNEAVVAVTRGALSRLNRDELQGIIGHEFSHILNGDMRLNVRLIGVLFGIQMVAGFGRQILDIALYAGRSKRRDDGPSLQVIMLVLGVSLFAIGYIGIFFGRLIKSAVSRQREYLADASAIQFTRNPDGIGNALRKIGGLGRKGKTARIHHPNAEHLSHLFLSAVSPGLLSGFFATHPPIPERLRRIFGKGVELLDAPELPEAFSSAEQLPDIPYVATGFAAAAAANDLPQIPVCAAASSMAAAMDEAAAPLPDATCTPKLRLAPELHSALHEPQGAVALIYALLLERQAGCESSLQVLRLHVPKQVAFVAYLAKSVGRLPRAARLPLVDLTMPALRQLPQAERDELLRVVEQMIAADSRVSLGEFVLETVLSQRLARHAGRAVPVRFSGLGQIREECRLLLSLVAHLAGSAAQAFMRGAALCRELELTAADLLEPSQLRFAGVRRALDHANQLAPLGKPALIKALVAVAGNDAELPINVADVLRACCAALEAPMPPALAAVYSGCDFLAAA